MNWTHIGYESRRWSKALHMLARVDVRSMPGYFEATVSSRYGRHYKIAGSNARNVLERLCQHRQVEAQERALRRPVEPCAPFPERLKG